MTRRHGERNDLDAVGGQSATRGRMAGVEMIRLDLELARTYADVRAVVGPLPAARVMAYIADWQLYLDEQTNGQVRTTELGMESFCAWRELQTGESRMTTYRRNAEFRKAFAKWHTPADMLLAAAAA